MNHLFHYRNRKYGYTHLSCTLFGRVLVTVLIVATIGLTAAGSWMDSFSFQFEGLAGQLLGQPPTYYSLVSLADSILPHDGPPDTGTAVLWVTFLLFALVLPLLYLVLILVLWVVPLTLYEQRKIHVVVEVIHAWSSIEVFVLSIVAALLELRQFAGFIVGDKCDTVNKLVAEYLSEALPAGDMLCFTVVTRLTTGTFVLVGASVMIISVGQYVMRTSAHALEDRTRRDGGRADSEAHEEWGMGPNTCADHAQIFLNWIGTTRLESNFEFDKKQINAPATPSRQGAAAEPGFPDDEEWGYDGEDDGRAGKEGVEASGGSLSRRLVLADADGTEGVGE